MAYKILAAGRRCKTPEMVRESFVYTFKNIKPGDVVDVGVFQKHHDQVTANAQLVREILA